MAAVTRETVVDITGAALVFAVHGRLRVRVTGEAAKDRVVRGVGVTVVTRGPAAGMGA